MSTPNRSDTWPASSPDLSTGIIAVVRAFSYNVTQEDLVVGSDRAAVRNTVSGTHRGVFMGQEPTGRRIEMRTMDIHQVRHDDRIIVTWHLEDFAGPMAHLTAPAGSPARAAWT